MYHMLLDHHITDTLSQTLNGVFNTVTALLATVDNWLRMLDEGSELRAVFFDLRKPFDSVPHKVLMKKLSDWSKYQHSGLGRKLSYFQ